jgi:hypothetical protein
MIHYTYIILYFKLFIFKKDCNFRAICKLYFQYAQFYQKKY